MMYLSGCISENPMKNKFKNPNCDEFLVISMVPTQN